MTTTSPARPSLLIIDDVPENIKILLRILKDDYELHYATSGRQALSLLAKAKKPDLILLDVMMPEMDGHELCAALKHDPETRDIPVIFITAKLDAASETQALAAGAVDFIHKPINGEVVRARVRLHLKLDKQAKELHLANAELTEWITILKSRVLKQTAQLRQKLEEAHQHDRRQDDRRHDSSDAIISALADLLEQRDQRLSRHSRIVASLAASMAGSLEFSLSQVEEIRRAGLLHDIGLIGLSDRLLVSNGELLNSDDAVHYRAHPVRGQKTIDSFDELQGIGGHILHHHEAFDGSGFPDGLSGKELTVGGKIIHLASFIESSFAQFSGTEAKYRVSRKVAAGMGTLFDPTLSAVANLAIKEVLSDSPVTHHAPAEQEIACKDLLLGMVLARDLYSSNGVLIVERGTRLTDDAMESIRCHQLRMPLGTVAYVHKPIGRSHP
jgi:response regulator RpfG family c-di-GMP phosphodiesterase